MHFGYKTAYYVIKLTRFGYFQFVRHKSKYFYKYVIHYFGVKVGLCFLKLRFTSINDYRILTEATNLREIFNKFHGQVGHPGINATVKDIEQKYF